MDIPGVPQSITREQYTALVAATGLEVDDLKSLEFRADGIYAEVFARDADGEHVIDGDDVMTHRVCVAVRD